MECRTCGGTVLWMGPLSNLTHTKCMDCGAINNQVVADERTELEDGDDQDFEASFNDR